MYKIRLFTLPHISVINIDFNSGNTLVGSLKIKQEIIIVQIIRNGHKTFSIRTANFVQNDMNKIDAHIACIVSGVHIADLDAAHHTVVEVRGKVRQAVLFV